MEMVLYIPGWYGSNGTHLELPCVVVMFRVMHAFNQVLLCSNQTQLQRSPKTKALHKKFSILTSKS